MPQYPAPGQCQKPPPPSHLPPPPFPHLRDLPSPPSLPPPPARTSPRSRPLPGPPTPPLAGRIAGLVVQLHPPAANVLQPSLRRCRSPASHHLTSATSPSPLRRLHSYEVLRSWSNPARTTPPWVGRLAQVVHLHPPVEASSRSACRVPMRAHTSAGPAPTTPSPTGSRSSVIPRPKLTCFRQQRPEGGDAWDVALDNLLPPPPSPSSVPPAPPPRPVARLAARACIRRLPVPIRGHTLSFTARPASPRTRWDCSSLHLGKAGGLPFDVCSRIATVQIAPPASPHSIPRP
jgi:hypothetical protein